MLPNEITVTKQVVRSKTQKGKLLNQYLKIKRIGQGPFSKIKLMTDIKTGKQLAMKKYNMFILRKKVKMGAKVGGQCKYSNQAQQVHNQVKIMKKLNHPNVVKLYDIIDDEEEQKVYLLMDYCKFGDVATWDHKNQSFLCKWTLKEIAKFFKQAALGLEYIHSLNIVHRDIKPQNILINQQGTAKIIDFGRSVLLENKQQKLIGSEGTYHFMAPEMLSQKIKGGYDGKVCDIWSLGVSLFSVVFGYIPFNDQFLMKLFQKIEKGDYQLPDQPTQSEAKFIPLIKEMLDVDWNKRPTISKVYSELEKIQNNL